MCWWKTFLSHGRQPEISLGCHVVFHRKPHRLDSIMQSAKDAALTFQQILNWSMPMPLGFMLNSDFRLVVCYPHRIRQISPTFFVLHLRFKFTPWPEVKRFLKLASRASHPLSVFISSLFLFCSFCCGGCFRLYFNRKLYPRSGYRKCSSY